MYRHRRFPHAAYRRTIPAPRGRSNASTRQRHEMASHHGGALKYDSHLTISVIAAKYRHPAALGTHGYKSQTTIFMPNLWHARYVSKHLQQSVTANAHVSLQPHPQAASPPTSCNDHGAATNRGHTHGRLLNEPPCSAHSLC